MSYVSTEDSYRTELFNQGKTAVTAYALMSNQVMLYYSSSTEQQEKSPTDGTIYIMECTVNGQSGMIAILKMPDNMYDGT